MALYVTASLGLPVIWGGITLGAAALAEIPALWMMGRLARRFSVHSLMISGCLAGIVYYVALVLVSEPITLLAIQLLNAWFVAVIAGLGMTVFQQIIPRPGLATGMYMNTRSIGAIVSGPIIAVAAIKPFGYPSVFALCAILTLAGTLALIAQHVIARRRGSGPEPAPQGEP
ncbi:MFS transporter [Microbacterium sp.]|uniref:MFS transporter n=1 Tax=Microbacterium sp. TaxID=51671 RepID=UPI003C720026